MGNSPLTVSFSIELLGKHMMCRCVIPVSICLEHFLVKDCCAYWIAVSIFGALGKGLLHIRDKLSVYVYCMQYYTYILYCFFNTLLA